MTPSAGRLNWRKRANYRGGGLMPAQKGRAAEPVLN
jgi:hypothetical protein